MQVDIISDTVCPWCYVGKRRLEAAMAARPEIRFELEWRPFELNPDMPLEGLDRQTYLAEKFGGEERAQAIYKAVEDAGHEAGIDFQFQNIKRMPNSRASHQVLMWARTTGHQNEIAERLFRAYFTEGLNIGDYRVLTDIAGEVGMDANLVGLLLQKGSDAEQIGELEKIAHEMGVTGVPCFVIERKYAIVGAESSDKFLQVFDGIIAEQAASQEA